MTVLRTSLTALGLMIALSLQSQQTEERMIRYTGYLLYVPQDLEPPFPMIVFLHGSGERGRDLDLVRKNGPPAFLDDTTGFPFVVLSPQCPEGVRWNTRMLDELIGHVIERVPIDQKRIYLTGLSMGGEGTWKLAMDYPDRFAAIAPVCGRNDLNKVCAIKDMPVWVFHGAKDDVVPPWYSDRIVDTLRAIGADVRYTLYPDANHNSWDTTYSNPELYAWFLEHEKDLRPGEFEKLLTQYAGTYRSENGEEFSLYVRGNRLRHITTEGSDFFYDRISEDVFRLPGAYTPDRDLEFKVNEEGLVIGFTLGPCEGRDFSRQ